MPRSTCARCSQLIQDVEEHVIAEGEAYHQRCWQILVAEAKVTESKKRLRKGEVRLRDEHWSDPICPRCMQPITRTHMVTGRRDRLMHAQCDPSPPPEPSALG
jgi:hypothetical protein